MITDLRLRVALAAITAAAVALFAFDVSGPVRTAALTAFVLLCPGLAWARRLPTRDGVDSLALAVGFGVCFVVVVGQMMALAQWWSPGTGLGVLAALTAVGLALPPKDSGLEGEHD